MGVFSSKNFRAKENNELYKETKKNIQGFSPKELSERDIYIKSNTEQKKILEEFEVHEYLIQDLKIKIKNAYEKRSRESFISIRKKIYEIKDFLNLKAEENNIELEKKDIMESDPFFQDVDEKIKLFGIISISNYILFDVKQDYDLLFEIDDNLNEYNINKMLEFFIKNSYINTLKLSEVVTFSIASLYE